MQYLLDGQQTARIKFRNIQESDFDCWLEFFHDPRSHQHWTPLRDSPEVECAQWYENQRWRYENRRGGMNALIERETEQLIGHAGLLVQTVDHVTELEIGYSLLPRFWGKGYATEAARRCRDLAFENGMAETLISIIGVTNKPSEKVALKNGMVLEKATFYRENAVHIFRVDLDKWHQLKSPL